MSASSSPPPAPGSHRTPTPGVLAQEIAEQPAALERQLRLARQQAETIATAIGRLDPPCIVLAARGSSDNAARYAQYLLGAHNQRLVSLATPSLFTLYGRPPRMAGTAVLGVSQSGRSPDIVAVLTEAKRQGALCIAITNDTSSPLAAVADECLPLAAGEERAVAATKTYTTQLCALAMLSAGLEQRQRRWQQLARLPELAAQTLELNADALADVGELGRAERLVVIGRGFNYATAFEIALKLQETSYLVAEPYSSADFRHGPSALLERGLPVVLVAPSGQVLGDVAALAELCAERSAELIVISDDQRLLDRAAIALPLPAAIPEWLSPVCAVLPGQRLAVAVASSRGLDPDRPRGLSKVTETR